MSSLKNGLRASLAKILDSHPDDLAPDAARDDKQDEEEESTVREVDPLACIECEGATFVTAGDRQGLTV